MLRLYLHEQAKDDIAPVLLVLVFKSHSHI